jgi:hypothetical protein
VSSVPTLWAVVAASILVLTVWGNVEFWRRRRRPSRRSSGIAAFSSTIDECESHPLIHPDGLEVRRKLV